MLAGGRDENSYTYVLHEKDLPGCKNEMLQGLVRANYVVTETLNQYVDLPRSSLRPEDELDFKKKLFAEDIKFDLLVTGEFISGNYEKVDTYVDEGITYRKITKLVLLSSLPGHDENNRTRRSIQVLFKKVPEGYRFISLSTNQPIVFYLWKNDRLQLEDFLILPGTSWQRFKSRWRALSPTYKIAAAIAITLGVVALLAGILFPPILAAATPATLLMWAGIGLTTIPMLGHTVDVLAAREQTLKGKKRSIGTAPKVMLGISIALGIAAIVIGAFFPPLLVAIIPIGFKVSGATFATGLIYGGATLTGVTMMGHTAHILRTPLPLTENRKTHRRGTPYPKKQSSSDSSTSEQTPVFTRLAYGPAEAALSIENRKKMVLTAGLQSPGSPAPRRLQFTSPDADGAVPSPLPDQENSPLPRSSSSAAILAHTGAGVPTQRLSFDGEEAESPSQSDLKEVEYSGIRSRSRSPSRVEDGEGKEVLEGYGYRSRSPSPAPSS